MKIIKGVKHCDSVKAPAIWKELLNSNYDSSRPKKRQQGKTSTLKGGAAYARQQMIDRFKQGHKTAGKSYLGKSRKAE